ncbi:hypothetical protein C8J48_1639 [Desmospora activa DSM 45169]|uniref:Uncharacterized protein n=2 Tax=Desmospora TaxID=500614 RepID=A0A2T4ZAX6_9BACL|nr:hypothetical protein C8J48_1639 [Desmospora activa DSM 45169]
MEYCTDHSTQCGFDNHGTAEIKSGLFADAELGETGNTSMVTVVAVDDQLSSSLSILVVIFYSMSA